MKLWMSAEIQADVADAERFVRLLIEPEVNRLLNSVPIEESADEWALITIILPTDFYKEIVRRSSKGKCLEFRLKIPHAQFLAATFDQQIQMNFAALSRSVLLMEKLKVSQKTKVALQGVLAAAERNVRAEAMTKLASPDSHQGSKQS